MATCTTIELPCYAPGTRHTLQVWRFGEQGSRPKVYIQAGIHADELPANLVACELIKRLKTADQAGQLKGEVIVVPVANPIGFTHVTLRSHNGRYHLPSGENYNRGWPDVCDAALTAFDGRPGPDRAVNTDALREAIGTALGDVHAANQAQALRLHLMRLAYDADIVLDLHTDSDAELHLYIDPDQWPAAEDLAALLDAKVVMLSRASGGGPFEETVAWPFVNARATYGKEAIELPLTVVVELRGEFDTSHSLAQQDAEALFSFLQNRGVIAGDTGELPPFHGLAAPFEATQTLPCPAAGIIVYRQELGAMVEPGDVLADIIDPLATDDPVAGQVKAETAGRFFARSNQRLAWPGEVIGKVQGRSPLPQRKGTLLYD
jgi:predicted deacylase